jgi:hypothetical protein
MGSGIALLEVLRDDRVELVVGCGGDSASEISVGGQFGEGEERAGVVVAVRSWWVVGGGVRRSGRCGVHVEGRIVSRACHGWEDAWWLKRWRILP